MLKYDNETDELVFSSGKRLYVHDGMIGISPDLSRLGYGADGAISWPTEWNEYAVQLSADDMRELCDEMINRWTQFRMTLAATPG